MGNNISIGDNNNFENIHFHLQQNSDEIKYENLASQKDTSNNTSSGEHDDQTVIKSIFKLVKNNLSQQKNVEQTPIEIDEETHITEPFQCNEKVANIKNDLDERTEDNSGEMQHIYAKKIPRYPFHFKETKDPCYLEVKRNLNNVHMIDKHELQAFGLSTYFDAVNRGEILTEEEKNKWQWFRFMSFYEYKGKGSACILALNGFYHEGSHGQDATRCFSCKVRYSNWQVGDDVKAIHRQLSPACNFHSELGQATVSVAGNNSGQQRPHTDQALCSGQTSEGLGNFPIDDPADYGPSGGRLEPALPGPFRNNDTHDEEGVVGLPCIYPSVNAADHYDDTLSRFNSSTDDGNMHGRDIRVNENVTLNGSPNARLADAREDEPGSNAIIDDHFDNPADVQRTISDAPVESSGNIGRQNHLVDNGCNNIDHQRPNRYGRLTVNLDDDNLGKENARQSETETSEASKLPVAQTARFNGGHNTTSRQHESVGDSVVRTHAYLQMDQALFNNDGKPTINLDDDNLGKEIARQYGTETGEYNTLPVAQAARFNRGHRNASPQHESVGDSVVRTHAYLQMDQALHNNDGKPTVNLDDDNLGKEIARQYGTETDLMHQRQHGQRPLTDEKHGDGLDVCIHRRPKHACQICPKKPP
ncbi:uncharacterized protein LOC128238050 isoform X3 [Mya arenaria]|uniref:uncharacterized protein LOC128237124 isoform X3 n=1 Tax=Mya arenaria TaxID=6604 RepID=UPI0022E739FB|nr:uncharacterized protein LOC128237124 isoform X3 [Mya arenaria]XP_052809585.1 uncharacterized protein LOC128238050 isoform X3 [Mya arenaria]